MVHYWNYVAFTVIKERSDIVSKPNTQTLNTPTFRFYTAQDVSKMLGISETSSYRIIKKLNDELKSKGYIVVPGKIGQSYFEKKVKM